MRYIRIVKPVEAMQLRKDNHFQVMEWLGYDYVGSPQDWDEYNQNRIMVETFDGTVTVKLDHYIVREKLDSGRIVTNLYDEDAFNIIFEPVEE